MTPKKGDKDRMSGLMRVGSFALGVGLVGAGIADALLNPFAFITADKLFVAGGVLIGIGVAGEGGKKK